MKSSTIEKVGEWLLGLLIIFCFLSIINACSDSDNFEVKGDHVLIKGEVHGVDAKQAKAVVQAAVDQVEKK